MELTIPGICYLRTSVPLAFDTDGYTTSVQPSPGRNFSPEHTLVLTDIHVQSFALRSVDGVSVSDSIEVPDGFSVPEIYDGTQSLSGKRVLVIMFNGWGDTILIKPALEALYDRTADSGDPPRISLGCNWIANFPYPDEIFIDQILPNILTFQEISLFDTIISLIPVNHGRSRDKSIKESCLEVLKLEPQQASKKPVIHPNAERVKRISPILDQIRRETGKKLLCVNWRSRFPHKNASPLLFAEILGRLRNEYHAVLFKDAENAKIMRAEIDEYSLPVLNLSCHIRDYHDTIAALSGMDAFVSVDTGIVHAAGALGVPGVALFGPFPPETHVSDYTSVVGVRAGYRGRSCAGPCLETYRGCAEVEYDSRVVSPCFQAIEPDEVVEALRKAEAKALRVSGSELRVAGKMEGERVGL
ncbi:MAG: glycosyltransferase family 9 protein [Pseudomonadota bacterium]